MSPTTIYIESLMMIISGAFNVFCSSCTSLLWLMCGCLYTFFLFVCFFFVCVFYFVTASINFFLNMLVYKGIVIHLKLVYSFWWLNHLPINFMTFSSSTSLQRAAMLQWDSAHWINVLTKKVDIYKRISCVWIVKLIKFVGHIRLLEVRKRIWMMPVKRKYK